MGIKERIRNMYMEALAEATDMYKSEYSYSKEDDEARDEEDNELLVMFETLLGALHE